MERMFVECMIERTRIKHNKRRFKYNKLRHNARQNPYAAQT
jgi:hypothetical protein